MGFQQNDVLPEEWEVVEAVARLIRTNPHWLANFGGNRVENNRIRSWDLRSTGLKSLPDNIGNLTMLETLDLGANMLRELPPSFGKLTNLRFLTINPDVLLPPELIQLENLTQVDTRDKGSSGGISIAGKGNVKHDLMDRFAEGYSILLSNIGIKYFHPEKMDKARWVQQEHPESTKEKELVNLTQILFFPYWRKLLESESFLGFYLNQPVYEIIKDNVILLPDVVYTGQEETTGETFIFLTGVGIYYVQFGLSPGEIITDYREITGIVLPLDTYAKAQDISGSVINSEKMMMTEYMFSVPFSLLLERQTTQMFLRGVIARNVVHPFKDCFNQFLKVCTDPNSLSKEEGFKILSGGLSNEPSLYKNELLTEIEITGYSKITAGLKNIQPKVGKILSDLQLTDEEMRNTFFEKVRLIKKDFVELGYPRILDWVP